MIVKLKLFVSAASAWGGVIALSDARFSTIIQTFGVIISTGITAVVGYMGLKLNQASKRRQEQSDE